MKPPKLAARFAIYMDRQAVGALHGLHWKSKKERRRKKLRHDNGQGEPASVNSRAMTISIAETWTL